jgi:hypothetical protein
MNVVCALLCCSNEKAKKERQKRATLTLCSWRAGEREEKEKEKERELCSRGRRTGGGRMYEPEKLVPLKKWQTLNTNRISLLLLQHLT